MERPFAHQYETGALRRVHVRGRNNVAKRVLIQAAAFNLALILRSITKAGTPKGLAHLNAILFCALWDVLNTLLPLFALTTSPMDGLLPISAVNPHLLANLRSSSSKFSRCRKWVF